MILVRCFGHEYRFRSQEKAYRFFQTCVRETRGSERVAYAKILCQIIDGKKVCEA